MTVPFENGIEKRRTDRVGRRKIFFDPVFACVPE
jgi:hypothetical protein